MNRKIIAFLSVFSLVLVLSIYYVMLPFSPNNNDSLPVNQNLNTPEAYFAALEVSKEQSDEKYVEKMNAIIASATSTNQQKVEALEKIANLNTQRSKEKQTKKDLVAAGYSQVYVEQISLNVSVIVAKNNFGYSDAATIMVVVFQNFGTTVSVEVTPTTI